MKILINTDTCLTGKGGIGRKIDELVSYVAQNRHDLELHVLQFGNKDYRHASETNIKIYEIDTQLKIEVGCGVYDGIHDIDGLHKRFSPIKEKIKSVLLKVKPDIVTMEGTFWAPWCLYHSVKEARNKDRLPDAPMVLDYAGVLSEETKGYPEKTRNILNSMEQDFNDNKLFYIFPSDLTKEKVEHIFRRNIQKFKVIPNGVSEMFFDGVDNGSPNGIGYVGRDSHVKNMRFMSNFKRVLKTCGKDRDMHIVSDFKTNSMEDLVAQEINVYPWQEKKELRQFYSNRSLMISPSHFETFGIAPLESIACGTPNIVSDNMGVREVYAELGLHDHILDINNVNRVISCMERLEGRRILKGVRNMLKKRYSWPVIMESYSDTLAQT